MTEPDLPLIKYSNFNYFETYTSINFYSTSAKFAGCLSTYPSNAGYTTVLGRTGNDDLNTTSVTGPITMWAQPVSVAIASTDLSLFTTTTTSSSSQSTASVGSIPTSTPTSTGSVTTITPSAASNSPDSASASASASASSNTGLSGGAIAGIAIAAAIIIGALIGLAIFFRQRKNHTQLAEPLTSTPNPEKPSPGEPYTYYAHELPPENAVVELNGYGQGPYSDHLHEMPGQDKPKGYSHYAQPVELGS
nr:cell wall integrity and stress response component 2-like [Quercus suber]